MKEILIKEAGFSSTYEKDRLEKLIDLTLNEVFRIIADPKNTNQCICTTFDASIASCFVHYAIDAISKEFNIKRPDGIKYETIMGRKV